MWDTAWDEMGRGATHLSHDRPCPGCRHAGHHYLPCDRCDCRTHAPSHDDLREPLRLG
jgi:hypothetical protein